MLSVSLIPVYHHKIWYFPVISGVKRGWVGGGGGCMFLKKWGIKKQRQGLIHLPTLCPVLLIWYIYYLLQTQNCCCRNKFLNLQYCKSSRNLSFIVSILKCNDIVQDQYCVIRYTTWISKSIWCNVSWIDNANLVNHTKKVIIQLSIYNIIYTVLAIYDYIVWASVVMYCKRI